MTSRTFSRRETIVDNIDVGVIAFSFTGAAITLLIGLASYLTAAPAPQPVLQPAAPAAIYYNPPILEVDLANLPPMRTATVTEKAASIRELAAGDAYYWRSMSDDRKSQAADALQQAKRDMAIARVRMIVAQAKAAQE